MVSATPHYSKDYARLPAMLASHLPSELLVGCSALGVVADGREMEEKPAIGLVAGSLPGVRCQGIHVLGPGLPDADAAPRAWESYLGVDRKTPHQFLVLGDPFCQYTGALLDGLDFLYPETAKIGALASGAGRPGGNALWLDGTCHREGLVVAAFSGDLTIDPLIFQSCRPIGAPLTVTCASRELLLNVDGLSPLEYLQELMPSLSETDQDLAQHALFVGIFSETPPGSHVPPGSLMRMVLGLDSTTGSMALAERVHEGERIQFHVRDRDAAAADINTKLDAYARNKVLTGSEGLLLFSCLGRGRHLFGETGFETGRIRSYLGGLPVGGFSCNGEIGPTGSGTKLHSYSTVLGVVRPAPRQPEG